jgi:hypothetical protein
MLREKAPHMQFEGLQGAMGMVGVTFEGVLSKRHAYSFAYLV